MINAVPSATLDNSPIVSPVGQTTRDNFQPSITPPAPDSSHSSPRLPSDLNDMQSKMAAPPSSYSPVPPIPSTSTKTSGDGSGKKPPGKRKSSIKMLLGGALLVLLVVGSGVGLYLSQQTQDIRQDASELTGTSSTSDTQATQSCSTSTCAGRCDNNPSCGITGDCSNCGSGEKGQGTQYCGGRRYDGCNDVMGTYLPALSNNSGNLGTITQDKWCTTVQVDAWGPAGSDARVAYISDGGVVCVEQGTSGDTCTRKDNGQTVEVNSLDWDCSATPPPTTPPSAAPYCLNAVVDAGTIVNGVRQIAPDQNAIYSVTGTAGTTKVEFCFHAKKLVGSRTWSQDWHCLQTPLAGSGDNLYMSSFKLNDIKTAIVNMNTGYTAAMIDTDGLMYATRIYTAGNVFCTGSDVWSDGGNHHGSTSCTYNDACTGDLAIAAKIAGPSCKSLAVTGGTVVGGVRQVDATTNMSFALTGVAPVGGTIARNQICFYPNTLGNKNDWSLGWYCVSPQPISTNPYSVSMTYTQIKQGILARDPNSAKITAAQIDADGFRYAGNVHAPDATFCDGGSNWTGLGNSLYAACTYNHGCAGNVKLTTTVGAQCGQICVEGKDQCAAGLECVSVLGGKQAYCAKPEYKTQCGAATGSFSTACCQAPVVYKCNSTCSTDAQCQKDLGIPYSCVQSAQGDRRCRLTQYPEQLNCKAPDQVCAGITMNPATPTLNSSVNFTCTAVTGVNNYQFRVIEPDGTITPLASKVEAVGVPRNHSEAYTVSEAGSFRAECRLCPYSLDGSCPGQEWPSEADES